MQKSRKHRSVGEKQVSWTGHRARDSPCVLSMLSREVSAIVEMLVVDREQVPRLPTASSAASQPSPAELRLKQSRSWRGCLAIKAGASFDGYSPASGGG